MPDRMELLAPAGDMDALRAAVQDGADAVYLGAGRFNARQRAGNFDGDGLRTAVDYCHVRGVKVHVTLNTLVRQDELEALYDTVRLINDSGADAVIVQDLGVARAVRELAPDLELHASTQMAAHSAQAVKFLKDAGFRRVVLARECTYEDMAACAATGIDVEAFVHGALCTACSGQCLMSSFIGGRSGNRGLCAQPCRLPWRFDGREGYLLSTRDLCGIDDLARLRAAGVKSLKIEGRLKRAEYVAVTVAAYRRALDALYGGRDFDARPEREAMAQMFNRGGFTRGYGPGVGESELMYPSRPNHIGVAVGVCRRPGEFDLTADVDARDALVRRRAGVEDVPVKLSGASGTRVKCPGAAKSDALVRLVSAAQMAAARDSFNGERRQTSVPANATLRVGLPARLRVSDVEVVGDVVQRATGKPFDVERARAQLCRTGGTPYRLDGLTIDADADAFVPVSALNALRRDALDALEKRRTAPVRRRADIRAPRLRPDEGVRPLLYAQSGDEEVLERAMRSGADVAVYSPEDIRALEPPPGALALALPAVLTGEALETLNEWAWSNRDRVASVFISNVGQLGMAWPGEAVGDYMLNVCNDLAVALLDEAGVSVTTPSLELTAAQIARMSGQRQLVVWGRIPLMHLRHCPLRAARGMEGPHAACRHCDACDPVDRLNGKTLTDRRGVEFPLNRIAMPGGCVAQVLNSVPLMPLKRLDRLPRASGWRLLLRADEPVEAVVKVYRAALDGREFRELPEWRTLEAMNTTAGHYFRGVE